MKAWLLAAAVGLVVAAGLAAQQQVRVTRMRELPAALRSDRTVLLGAGEYITSEVAQTSNPAVSWEQEYDGPQLVVTGVRGLTLRAPQGGARLVAVPRYAYTITFRDCRDIRLEGLTLGHTEAGECSGGVLRFEGCTNVQIRNCDMFGSGVIGLDLEECSNVSVRDSTIRDCTYGALDAVGVQELLLQNVRFAGNEAWPLVSLDASRGVVLDSCTIEGNVGDGLFWVGPDCRAVSLPRTTIRGNETDTLVYEDSQAPDFSTASFIDNIFADQEENGEGEDGCGCEEGYEEGDDDEYDGSDGGEEDGGN